MCSCGRYNDCIRKIHVTYEGKMYVEPSEHFACGIIENQILTMSKKLENVTKRKSKTVNR